MDCDATIASVIDKTDTGTDTDDIASPERKKFRLAEELEAERLILIYRGIVKKIFEHGAKYYENGMATSENGTTEMVVKDRIHYEDATFHAIHFDAYSITVKITNDPNRHAELKLKVKCVQLRNTIGYTHYVCLPLQENLASWHQQFKHKINELFSDEEYPPKFSEETGKRLHLTLARATITTVAEYQSVVNMCERVSKSIREEPLKLELSGLEQLDGGRIIYLEVIDDFRLVEELVAPLSEGLRNNKIATEPLENPQQDFLSHITILRQSGGKSATPCADEILKVHRDRSFGELEIDKIRLVTRSTYDYVDFPQTPPVTCADQKLLVPEAQEVNISSEIPSSRSPFSSQLKIMYNRYASIISRFCRFKK